MSIDIVSVPEVVYEQLELELEEVEPNDMEESDETSF